MQDAPGDGSGVGWQSLVSAAITIVAGIGEVVSVLLVLPDIMPCATLF